jgi:adenosylcobinamide-GDP ribazoletransferase
VLDAIRLAVGTLTVLPVPAPRTVDRHTWRTALALAPVVGAALGAIAWSLGWAVNSASDSALLAAVVTVAAFAVLTRGLHLDGLADVADGLGSRRPADEARQIMRRSDIGPFGVLAIVFIALLQVAALAAVYSLSAIAPGAIAVIGAAVIARTGVVAACRRGQPTVSDGLGSQAVGSVPTALALAVVLLAATATVAAAVSISGDAVITTPVAAVIALSVGELWRHHCGRRLGAITGDVLGSVEEITATTFLVVIAMLW